MNEEEKLLKELNKLEHEHHELDGKITQLLDEMCTDQLYIQRLKKRKLWIKDRIGDILDALHPDIIA